MLYNEYMSYFEPTPRDEEVGHSNVDPEDIKRYLAATNRTPQVPQDELISPAVEQEEEYVPPTPEQEEERKREIKLTRARLQLPHIGDRRRTAEHDAIDAAIVAYLDGQELILGQQEIIDKLLTKE